MGGGVARITLGLAAAVLLSAAAAQAQIPISVDDLRIVEGSGGFWSINIAVRPTGPPPSTLTVDYTILPGSALSGSDYTAAPSSGTLTFPALSIAPQYIPGVQINGDLIDEWSPTLQEDQVFFVQLSNPSAGAVIDKGRGTVTIVDDDQSANPPGVQFLTAVSTGTAAIGQNKLQWRIPGASPAVANVKIVWKQGPGCTFPLSDTDTAGGGVVSVGSAVGAGLTQSYPHTNRPIGVLHCYSVIAYNGIGIPSAQIAHVKATPIDTTGTLAWTYASGATSVVPPSVGTDAVYTVDNLGVVHAMKRGVGGGDWPSTWNPVAVGKPTQNRSAVVPMGSRSRLFLGTDGGGVHAVDGKTGTLVWSRSAAFSNALPNISGVQAQPAGLFKAFGGNNDMLLVGTNAGASNNFFALDPNTGGNLGAPYPNGLMGNVTGMAVVDYPSNRVFFLTTQSSATLFGLDMGPVGTPTLTLATVAGGNPRSFTGSNGSAVLRNNRLIWGDNGGQMFAVDLALGTSYNAATGDGAVKGFLWPDRRDDRLYYATNGNVQCMRDNVTSFVGPIWSVPVTTPSMVLQKPGTDYVYVGDGLGRLIQIKVSDQSTVPLMLESGVQIGAPSLDGPNAILVVGSATGNIYAVRVPY